MPHAPHTHRLALAPAHRLIPPWTKNPVPPSTDRSGREDRGARPRDPGAPVPPHSRKSHPTAWRFQRLRMHRVLGRDLSPRQASRATRTLKSLVLVVISYSSVNQRKTPCPISQDQLTAGVDRVTRKQGTPQRIRWGSPMRTVWFAKSRCLGVLETESVQRGMPSLRQ